MARKHISDIQVVICCWYFHAHRFSYCSRPDELLEDITGEPYKVCLAAMERANKRDLIDWGVSLRTAWPTYKGIQKVREAGLNLNKNNLVVDEIFDFAREHPGCS